MATCTANDTICTNAQQAFLESEYMKAQVDTGVGFVDNLFNSLVDTVIENTPLKDQAEQAFNNAVATLNCGCLRSL